MAFYMKINTPSPFDKERLHEIRDYTNPESIPHYAMEKRPRHIDIHFEDLPWSPLYIVDQDIPGTRKPKYFEEKELPMYNRQKFLDSMHEAHRDPRK